MKSRIFLVLAAALALLGTVLRQVRGMRFSGMVALSAALFVTLYALLRFTAKRYRWAEWLRRAMLALLCIGLVIFAGLEALVIRDAHTAPEAAQGGSCVIVLGAGVNGTVPSLSLRVRLDAALDYLNEHPDMPVIVSGGQGGGEAISEAECMARYLIAHGIEESRIIREDRSTSTRENFAFSIELMVQNGIDPADAFVFVTSDYHICRAARMAGVPWAYGVAARLPHGAYYTALEVNYFLREAAALAWEIVLGG